MQQHTNTVAKNKNSRTSPAVIISVCKMGVLYSSMFACPSVCLYCPTDTPNSYIFEIKMWEFRHTPTDLTVRLNHVKKARMTIIKTLHNSMFVIGIVWALNFLLLVELYLCNSHSKLKHIWPGVTVGVNHVRKARVTTIKTLPISRM